MKKLFTVLMCATMVFGIAGCGKNSDPVGNDNSQDNQALENMENESEKSNSANSKMIDNVEVGKEFNYHDIFKMTITSIEETDERDDTNDIDNLSQVIKITYKYENINAKDDLHIGDQDFQIIDEDGNVAESYFMFEEEKDAASIPSGAKTDGNGFYALKYKSKKIRVRLNVGIDGIEKKVFDLNFDIK